MEMEEWLSQGLSLMQWDKREMEGLLAMTERLCTQPSLNGCPVTSGMMAELDELARCSCSWRTTWLSYVYRIGMLIGPDGALEEPVQRPWERWSLCSGTEG